MPTYEYACSQCGQHVEVVQSFTDEPLTTCSACGGPLRKVFGSVGIVLKGSGFYRTDSRASTSKTAVKNGTETAAGAKSESGGKAESGAKADGGTSKPDGGAAKTESGAAKSDSKTAGAAAN